MSSPEQNITLTAEMEAQLQAVAACVLCGSATRHTGIWQLGQEDLKAFNVPEGKSRIIFYKLCEYCKNYRKNWGQDAENAVRKSKDYFVKNVDPEGKTYIYGPNGEKLYGTTQDGFFLFD